MRVQAHQVSYARHYSLPFFGGTSVRHERRERSFALVPTLIHELLTYTLQAAAEKITVSVEASRALEGSYSMQAERGSPHIPFP
jgi:hypothetical protein